MIFLTSATPCALQISPIIRAGIQANANSALPRSTGRNIGIGVPLGAHGLLGIERSKAGTTEGILSRGNRLDVERTSASCVSTKMVTLQPFGDWADQCLISEAMRIDPLAAPSKEAVTLWLLPTSRPFPASVIEHANLAPKSKGK